MVLFPALASRAAWGFWRLNGLSRAKQNTICSPGIWPALAHGPAKSSPNRGWAINMRTALASIFPMKSAPPAGRCAHARFMRCKKKWARSWGLTTAGNIRCGLPTRRAQRIPMALPAKTGSSPWAGSAKCCAKKPVSSIFPTLPNMWCAAPRRAVGWMRSLPIKCRPKWGAPV